MVKRISKIYIFFWRYPAVSLLLSFIKGVSIGFFVCTLMGCAKYQVVQSVRVNMYHLHNPKKGIEIILTKDTLEVGKWYRLKQLNIVVPTEEINYNTAEKRIRQKKSKTIHESKMNKYQK